MAAWIFQDPKQVKKLGADNASHYVGWIDPDGKKRCKSCGPGTLGLRKAEKLKEKRSAELLTGTYQDAAKKTWKEFREEYQQKIMDGMSGPTRHLTAEALDSFERIIKPGRIGTIKVQTIDQFIRERSAEPGKKGGSLVSPATVNKQLRHLRSVLTVAKEWGYLKERPRFRMVKEQRKLVKFVTGEHFAAIYAACDQARKPVGLAHVTAADWWRGLIVFGYMTGWRISELLALRRSELDLDAGTALTRAEDNKGGRDDRVKLHAVAVAHLRALAGFDQQVFQWPHDRRTLDTEWHRIQACAQIHLPCHRDHGHTDACHFYGFHDLRRAFATQNAPRLTADALQKLMRHKSYATTQRYINMASQLDEAVDSLHVPEVLKKGLG